MIQNIVTRAPEPEPEPEPEPVKAAVAAPPAVRETAKKDFDRDDLDVPAFLRKRGETS